MLSLSTSAALTLAGSLLLGAVSRVGGSSSRRACSPEPKELETATAIVDESKSANFRSASCGGGGGAPQFTLANDIANLMRILVWFHLPLTAFVAYNTVAARRTTTNKLYDKMLLARGVVVQSLPRKQQAVRGAAVTSGLAIGAGGGGSGSLTFPTPRSPAANACAAESPYLPEIRAPTPGVRRDLQRSVDGRVRNGRHTDVCVHPASPEEQERRPPFDDRGLGCGRESARASRFGSAYTFTAVVEGKQKRL
ncbi:hypothetical protein DFH06DRAFT_1351064 [Mycena polygramma]|nr:hypothetical protein DFH06DRAFT_1351064 [Mycena polygramma]